METEYDLSNLKSRRNPHASRAPKPVTMRLSEDVISCFQDMAQEVGIPFQSLISLYLLDCVARRRKVKIAWQAKP